MLIKSYIEFYSTCLSSDYSNVYDFVENYPSSIESRYREFLSNNFPRKVISLANDIRSRKDTNGNFIVVIPNYSSMDLHDYNYASFVTKIGNSSFTKFAFVLSVSSANDGENSKSVIVELKLDAWINNYYELHNGVNNFIATKSTVDDNSEKFLKAFDSVVRSTKTIEKSVFNNGNTDYLIVWQEIEVAKPVDVKYQTASWNTGDNQAIMNEGITIIYRPVAVVNIKTRKLLNINRLMINGEYAQYPSGQIRESRVIIDNQNLNDQSLRMSNIIPNGTYAVANKLTYATPFECEVTSVTEISQNLYNVSARLSDDIIFAFGEAYVSNNAISLNSNYTPIIAPYTRQYTTDTYNYKDYEVTSSYGYIGINNSHLKTDIESIVRAQPAFYNYPFHYKSVVIAGLEYSLMQVPSSDGKFILRIHHNGRQCNIRIITSLGEYLNYFNNEVNTTLPIVTDALSDYLALNSNRMYSQYQNAIVSGLLGLSEGIAVGGILGSLSPMGGTLGATLGAVKGIVNTGGNLWTISNSQSALKADLKKYSNKVTGDGLSSFSNIEYLDDCIIIDNYASYNRPEIFSLIYDIHCNGYSNGKCIDIFSIRRDLFDYVEGNFSIKAQMNNDDRKEIENALSNGIRFWHINENDTDVNDDNHGRNYFLKNFNTMVANPCLQNNVGGNN